MFKRIVCRGGAPSMARVWIVAVSLGVVLTLAGCEGGNAYGGSTAGAPASTTASAAASGTASAAGNGGGNGGSGQGGGNGQGSGGSGGGSASACLLNHVSIKTGPYLSPAGTGIAAEPIILTNTGSSSCSVLGWPGVAALDSGDNQVYQAARIGSEGSAITLPPGSSASAVLYAVVSLGGSKYAGSSPCAMIPNLLVTPPNETHSGQVGFGSAMCVTPALTALLPGTDGTVDAPAEFFETLQLWKAGAAAQSYIQGSYEIEAENFLTNAVGAGAPGTSGFLTASNELMQLASLPDAMMSPTQQAEFNTDVAALDSFFGTPGLYH